MILRKKTKARKSAGTEIPTGGAKPLNRAQYEALAGFRYALRAFLAFSEAAAQAVGVSPQQYQAMLAIKSAPRGALLVGALAEQLFIKHNAAVQMADRLSSAGLVRRVSSAADRRAVDLQLTAKGERCIGHLAAIHYRELMRRRSELGEILRRSKRLR